MPRPQLVVLPLETLGVITALPGRPWPSVTSAVTSWIPAVSVEVKAAPLPITPSLSEVQIRFAERSPSSKSDAEPEPAPVFEHRLDDAAIEAMFRSQLVWDTTMAASIARARFLGAPKVIHLVGQFHSDFEGGTVDELRKRMPGGRILVISMQRAWPEVLRPEDVGRADVIVYTGEPEEEEEEEEEEEAVDDKEEAPEDDAS